MPAEGLSDMVVLRRLGFLYGGAFVKSVEDELVAARTEGGLEGGTPARVAEIHECFTYRMHNRDEFMKSMLQRFTRWFHRTYNRTYNSLASAV